MPKATKRSVKKSRSATASSSIKKTPRARAGATADRRPRSEGPSSRAQSKRAPKSPIKRAPRQLAPTTSSTIPAVPAPLPVPSLATDPRPASPLERDVDSPAPRAPVRKIVSGGRVVPLAGVVPPETVVADTPASAREGPSNVVAFAHPASHPTQATQSPPIELPRRSWREVPPSVPPHVRFIMSAALQECSAASSSPFSYAKFLALLPERICGLDFALLLLTMELESNAIARTSLIDQPTVEAHLERGRAELRDLFSAMCSDMSRRWRSQLGSSRLGLEPLIDQYLISEVDRDFQGLIGALLLTVMGGVHVRELPALMHGNGAGRIPFPA